MRIVELVFRANNTQAIRALTQIGRESERTARQTERSFYRSQRALRGTAAIMGSVGRGMTAVGAGIAGVGYEAVKSAVNFQTAMTRINTQAKVPAGEVDKLNKAVLALGGSGTVAYGPTELAKALYHIESVASGNAVKGISKTSNAMYALKAAADGAAIGGSNLEDTTTALMGAMVTLHAPASKAREIMGLLNTTVGIGNMRMQDLVTSLGRGALPAFISAGMGAKDLFAALALTADQGTKASSAAAQLATALHYLADPTSKATKMFGQFNADKIAKDMAGPGGLLKALTDVNDLLNGMPKAERNKYIYTLMPAGRGRVLQQILNNLDQYGKEGKLGKFVHNLSDFNKGTDALHKTLGFKLHAALATIKTDLTKLGDTLIPVVAHWLPRFTGAIRDVFGWLTRLPTPLKNFLVPLTVALFVGGPILVGLSHMIRAFTHLRDILFAVRGAGFAAAEGEAAAGGGAAAAGGGGAAAAAKGALRAGGIAGLLTLGGGYLADKLSHGATSHPLKKGQHPITGPLRGPITGHYQGPLAGLLNMVGVDPTKIPLIGGLFGAHGGLVTPSGIRRYQFGGPVGTDTIPAWLTAGEGVLNRTAMAGLGTHGLNQLNSGGGLGQLRIESAPVYLVLDGRIVARSVLKQVLNKAARGPSSLIGGNLVTGVSVPVNRGFG